MLLKVSNNSCKRKKGKNSKMNKSNFIPYINIKIT